MTNAKKAIQAIERRPAWTGFYDREWGERLFQADILNQAQVKEPSGSIIGHLVGILVGKRQGRSEMAILSGDNGEALDERCYPVPWEALTYDQAGEGYVLDFGEEVVGSGPSYECGKMPQWSYANLLAIFNFYRIAY